jgi:preprotein translocase subunit SecG
MNIFSTLFMLLLLFTAIFMILLILVQRGKGGGLAGAFGGLGGQSAFGTKAGDTFTRITIGVAAFWILICVLGVRYLGEGGQRQLGRSSGTSSSAPAKPGAKGSTRQTPAGSPASRGSTAPRQPASAPASKPAGK